MSEALARLRNDSILIRPVKAQATSHGVVARLANRARILPARVYLGAAFSALLAGIGVNALLLQRERHPAPFFSSTRPHASPALSNAAPAQPSASVGPSLASSPAARKSTAGGEAPARPLDQIGELLHGEASGDPMVLAAQGALAKLGYSVKPDGLEGPATQQALRDFERGRGLPVTTDVTPHLLKQLTAAMRAASR